ncbi:MAG: formyltransferase family protein [bacterium]|nr:formyltransferase family protein [bacterium]
MKILILTSALNGTAAHHLEVILKEPSIQVVSVIYSQGAPKSFYKKAFQKFRKILKIGLLGALNGIKMRKWYHEDVSKYVKIQNLEDLCKANRVPFSKTMSINSEDTIELFKASGAEIGISLGNGYITNKIFTILPEGMLNIHHEILPEFQNAQSVIWQIYNGSNKTGYTIHKINKKIDTGEILYQKELPIIFKGTLAETVSASYAEVLKQSAIGLVTVLKDYRFFLKSAVVQRVGHTYTTPSFTQFLKMKRQFKKLINTI